MIVDYKIFGKEKRIIDDVILVCYYTDFLSVESQGNVINNIYFNDIEYLEILN